MGYYAAMLPRITSVNVVGPLQMELSFSDGSSGKVDLRSQIQGRGGVFLRLQDPEYFALVSVDADSGTLVWPNGVDLDPDVLYAAVQSALADC